MDIISDSLGTCVDFCDDLCTLHKFNIVVPAPVARVCSYYSMRMWFVTVVLDLITSFRAMRRAEAHRNTTRDALAAHDADLSASSARDCVAVRTAFAELAQRARFRLLIKRLEFWKYVADFGVAYPGWFRPQTSDGLVYAAGLCSALLSLTKIWKTTT
jgi:hypothetical protein